MLLADIPPVGDSEVHQWTMTSPGGKRCKRPPLALDSNEVPYRVYKGASDVLMYLWKLMVIVWKKGTILRMRRRAGGIFSLKEKNTVTIGQIQPISLLNVEGKIFFVWVARRLVSYLKADLSVQKAGIPEFSGCLEHSSMIWHQIQAARTEGRDLCVVFLDLANAFGSVPHSLLWKAFSYFQVPEKISALVRAYFEDIQLCFNTSNYTTS